jgi:hypothetical protein
MMKLPGRPISNRQRQAKRQANNRLPWPDKRPHRHAIRGPGKGDLDRRPRRDLHKYWLIVAIPTIHYLGSTIDSAMSMD